MEFKIFISFHSVPTADKHYSFIVKWKCWHFGNHWNQLQLLWPQLLWDTVLNWGGFKAGYILLFGNNTVLCYLVRGFILGQYFWSQDKTYHVAPRNHDKSKDARDLFCPKICIHHEVQIGNWQLFPLNQEILMIFYLIMYSSYLFHSFCKFFVIRYFEGKLLIKFFIAVIKKVFRPVDELRLQGIAVIVSPS